VRIFTGARLPDGADTVVVQEDVARDGDRVRLTGDGPSREGAHIRRAGLDFGAGETVLRAGDRLTPARIGLAAASGNAVLKVVRRPRVALLATGDELVPPGITPGDDQIVSSHGVMLAALLRNIADVRDLGLQPDDAGSISRAIAAAADADLLLTIGGASVGERDLVQQALRDAGADIDFWKVAIKPGKPMIAGVLGDTRVLGLPGNPVSAFVCAVLFALPMLRKMAGFTDPHHRIVEARLLSDLPANGPRRDHIRARFDGVGVAPAPVQDSAMLSVLASSNALIVREAGAAAANPGDTVPLLLLDS
jgi:molybdopterin molybdotransferase